PVGDGAGEHAEGRIQQLADDRVEGLLVESLVRIPDAGVETGVALGDRLVGRGVIETVAGDAEATHGYRRHVGENEPVAGLVPPVVLDPWRTRAELALEPFEHLSRFDNVGVTREVPHEPIVVASGTASKRHPRASAT